MTQSFSGLDASTEYDFRFRATNIVGDSPYSFPVRETTDDAPPVTVDHTVDGGDLTWGFEIPEATVTHTPAAATTDHAVNGGDLTWGFEIPEATVTHVEAGGVTVSLTGYQLFGPLLRWPDNVSLGTMFSSDGAEQTLDSLDLYFSGQVGIAIVGLEHDFTPAFEATGRIIIEASDGETLEIQIANADMSDSYIWTPTNGAEVTAFATHIRDDLTDRTATLTLRGGGTPTTQDHAVNGGDLDWGFELPEATVTIVRAAGFDHEVDGGNLRWGFAIPQATVTLVVAAGPVDHAVDGGSLSWGFYLPRARVAHSGIAEYTLEVDWDNDGSYANANADVWGRVIEGTFRCRRGRNFASQRSGRSVAGSLEVQLDNRDGLLDPDNTPGPLNGLLSGGRRVRWRMNDGNGILETQWTGWLRTIEQMDQGTGLDRIRLRALGVISRLNPPRIGQQQQPVVVGQQTNINVQVAARLIFDPDGSIGSADAVVDGVDYRASYIRGTREMARWWAARPRLVELRDLEQTEGGFLLEPKDGFIGMEATDYRQRIAAQVSQATFVDTNPTADQIPAIANGIKPDHPYEDLANVITSQVRTYGIGAEEVLWSVDAFPIAGSSDFTIVIRYPHEDAAFNRVAVSSWTALTAGTDYDAQAGVTLTLTTDGNNATIRIQNTNLTATTMDIQLRGAPIVRNQAVEIITPDQDSIDEVGQPIPYPFATPWLSSPVTVKILHDILLRLYSSPAERLTLTWEVESDRAKAASLDLSDRVEVMRRNEATEYFIESIRHRVTAHFHFITMTLSPAGIYGSLFVMGVSRYGEGTISA